MSFKIPDDDSIRDKVALYDANDSETLLKIFLVNPGQFKLLEEFPCNGS